LEKICTRDINTSDPQSLKKVSVALTKSRDKINALESRINAARRAELAAGKPRQTPLPVGYAVSPSNPMSEGLFKKKLQELAKSMETGESAEQLSAVNSVRELQASYPDRDYSVVVIPLMQIVKNEQAGGPLRIVAARVLSCGF
jgi:hypothetical protein